MTDEENLGKKFPESALILDDDEVFLKTVSLYAKKTGIQSFETFTDCDSVWGALRKNSYDIMLLDWKLPGKVSGLALFNRIRRRSKLSLSPVLVISGFVEKDDFRLLDEFPCTALLEKPFTFQAFTDKIKGLWTEYQWYLKNLKVVQGAFTTCEHDPEKAVPMFMGIIKNSPNPVPLTTVVGKFLSDQGCIDQAEPIFLSVLKYDAKNVFAMSELAKIYYKQNRIDEAINILGAAHEISPHNMERLCFSGQLEVTKGNTENAKAKFAKALEIDEEDTKARSGMLIAGNATEFFSSAANSISVTKNFASLMNIIGISKIKAGSYKDGLTQYLAALNFLDDPTDQARVMFNVGLGHLKNKNVGKASKWFQRAALAGGKSFDKPGKYLQEIEKYRKKGPTKESLTSPPATDIMAPPPSDIMAPPPPTISADEGGNEAPGPIPITRAVPQTQASEEPDTSMFAMVEDDNEGETSEGSTPQKQEAKKNETVVYSDQFAMTEDEKEDASKELDSLLSGIDEASKAS